jgi:hypothetical protein
VAERAGDDRAACAAHSDRRVMHGMGEREARKRREGEEGGADIWAPPVLDFLKEFPNAEKVNNFET